MATLYPPDTPADISVFVENGQFVFRVGDSQSIYVYDRDTNGMPTCTGDCAKLWQPLLASAGSQPVGTWTLVNRTDESKQWRHRNQPVYTYVHDKPGDTLGGGVDGVWHLVTA